MPKQEDYLAQIKEWDYCYCRDCGRMRYGSELEVTERGIRCSKCGGYDLEAPAWIECPYRKFSMVKCPRAGKGIKQEEHGYNCEYHCDFIV